VNGLAFSNIKVWNEPTPFLESDVNEHSVLATLLSDGKDCRYGSHIVSFPTMESSLFGWNHFVGSIRTIPLSQRNALHSSVSISRRRSPAITAEILRRLTAQDELQLQGSLFITWGLWVLWAVCALLSLWMAVLRRICANKIGLFSLEPCASVCSTECFTKRPCSFTLMIRARLQRLRTNSPWKQR